MRQHRGSTANGGALHGGNQRLVELEQRSHQPGLRRVPWPWRIPQKILYVIARTKRISWAMPEHDACALVLGRSIEDIREKRVHAQRHRVSLRGTIQLHAKEASGLFRNDLFHRPPSVYALFLRPLEFGARLPWPSYSQS
jgi:hypothetical protein